MAAYWYRRQVYVTLIYGQLNENIYYHCDGMPPPAGILEGPLMFAGAVVKTWPFLWYHFFYIGKKCILALMVA